jgi:hypothetical protein
MLKFFAQLTYAILRSTIVVVLPCGNLDFPKIVKFKYFQFFNEFCRFWSQMAISAPCPPLAP